MYKYRINARSDNNQADIVGQLRSIPGVTVETDKDDILVGFRGVNYWYEIKDPSAITKAGVPIKGELKKNQIELLATWMGHYKVVWTIEQILFDLGITKRGD